MMFPTLLKMYPPYECSLASVNMICVVGWCGLMAYPLCVLRLLLQNWSSCLQSLPILKKLSQCLSSFISAYMALVMRDTNGPSDRRMDDSVPVIDDRMLGVVVPLSQMVWRRVSSLCSFFSGMVNCMVCVFRCTPSHSPSCVGVSSLFSWLTRKPAACRS